MGKNGKGNPQGLTLELGDYPTPAQFLAAAKAWLHCIQVVAEAQALDGQNISWYVQVRAGSNLLDAIPHAPNRHDIVKRASTAIIKGVRSVAAGKLGTSGLPPAVWGDLKTLSELATSNGKPGLTVRLLGHNQMVEVTPRIAAAIEEDARSDYRDYGTIDGHLQAIQDKNGSLQFHVKDRLFTQPIRCYIGESQLPTAFRFFRKRVEVTGTIHYRKSGQPISIQVANIESLPDDSELPTPDEMRGFLKVGRR